MTRRYHEMNVTVNAPRNDYKSLARLNLVVADETRLPGLFGAITLRCRSDAVDLQRVRSGLVNLCADHDLATPIGRIPSVTLAEGIMSARAEIAVTDGGEKYLAELDQGLRLGCSPGFIIHEVEQDDDGDGLDIIVTSWEPYEISLTSGPRNPAARVTGRYSAMGNIETLESAQLVNAHDLEGLSLAATRRALADGKVSDLGRRQKLGAFFADFDRRLERGEGRAAAIAAARQHAGL